MTTHTMVLKSDDNHLEDILQDKGLQPINSTRTLDHTNALSTQDEVDSDEGDATPHDDTFADQEEEQEALLMKHYHAIPRDYKPIGGEDAVQYNLDRPPKSQILKAWKQKDLDCQAFPLLFPSGERGYDPPKRRPMDEDGNC